VGTGAENGLTCYPHVTYHCHMPKMIQLRHVPDDLHRILKARAALQGVPLSEYLIREARRLAERPTLEELRRRLAERSAVKTRISPAQAVRAERERR
jgi:antitoxin FitA